MGDDDFNGKTDNSVKKQGSHDKHGKAPELNTTKAGTQASTAQTKKEISLGKSDTRKMEEIFRNGRTDGTIASQGDLKKHDTTPNNRGASTDLALNVSPDIFVSLKKGLIGTYYKVGKVLGEGKL